MRAWDEFQATGAFGVPRRGIPAGKRFVRGSATAIDDAATEAAIRETYRTTGTVLDPHSAVGVAAARRVALDPEIPVVALACAHPAKFPELVTRATGVHPALPAHMADLFDRPERIVTLPNDLATVQAFVRAHARVGRYRRSHTGPRGPFLKARNSVNL